MDLVERLIKKNIPANQMFRAGKEKRKNFNYKKALEYLKKKDEYYYDAALKIWPRGIELSKAISKRIKSKAKTLPMKKLRLKEDINLNKMSAESIYFLSSK